MSRKRHNTGKWLLISASLALGAPGIAFADDSSMSRFGGDSYAYFNQPHVVAPATTWWQSHPDGVPEQELQALSSSGLSAAASRLNPPTFARAPADPAWREVHPNGLSERELQALSSSSLAMWQSPVRIEVDAARSNVALTGKQAERAF